MVAALSRNHSVSAPLRTGGASPGRCRRPAGTVGCGWHIRNPRYYAPSPDQTQAKNREIGRRTGADLGTKPAREDPGRGAARRGGAPPGSGQLAIDPGQEPGEVEVVGAA